MMSRFPSNPCGQFRPFTDLNLTMKWLRSDVLSTKNPHHLLHSFDNSPELHFWKSFKPLHKHRLCNFWGFLSIGVEN